MPHRRSVPSGSGAARVWRLSQASGHNRAELERRLGHANDPPDDIAASYVEHLW